MKPAAGSCSVSACSPSQDVRPPKSINAISGALQSSERRRRAGLASDPLAGNAESSAGIGSDEGTRGLRALTSGEKESTHTMPAVAFNALAAVVIHTQLADFQPAAFGIPNDMQGLLINSITPKPTRTKLSKTDHLGFEGIIDIYKNPQYMLEVDAEDYMTTGKFNGRHPGEAISRADVGNYVAATRHQFPDSGYFVFDSVEPGLPAADLHKNKFSLLLKWTPEASVQVLTPVNAV
jgi:hypothetical protein